MLKGLSSAPKPFLKSVILEDSNQTEIQNKSQVDLYYDNPVKNITTAKPKTRITLDFYIKAMAEYSPDNSSINVALKNILTQSYLFWIPITSKQQMINFVKLTEEDKKTYVNDLYKNQSVGVFNTQLKNFFNGQKMQDYVSIVEPKSFTDMQQRMFTMPVKVHNIFDNNGTPDFLGYIYFLSGISGQNLVGFVQNSFGTEIVYNDKQPLNQTGYFIIDSTYRFNDTEETLTKAEIPTNLNLIDPSTGESILPNVATDRNQQVNYLYGAPGDIWVGPVHFYEETNPNSPNAGLFRAMAGAEHNDGTPHPFLKYVVKGNNKIIDFRGINAFEDLFSYKSSLYESILAASSNILYTGQKRNKLIDDFVQKKAVVSELKYSIRREESLTVDAQKNAYKNDSRSPVLVFSIDKRSLLKETTKLPTVLDKIIKITPSLYDELTQNIDILSFEFIRIHKKENLSKTIMVSPNDSFHIILNEDESTTEQKPVVFSNQTNQVLLFSNENEAVSLYEFFDGQINATTDNGEYGYKIKLKYRDPVISYLNDKLIQLVEIISNLDELSQKINFMILDPLTGKYVNIYDRFQNQLNPTFVQQVLNGNGSTGVPLSFSFDQESELPSSVNSAFPVIEAGEQFGGLQSLTGYIAVINSYFLDSSAYNFTYTINSIKNFIRSSLTLSLTTPELIDRVRSLLDLVRARTEDLITIYSTEQIVKKSSGFTDKDYIKSTNVQSTDTHVIEFEHEFENTLDLSKTKDFFDWISPEPAVSQVIISPLRTISVNSYKRLVKGAFETLTEYGAEELGKDSDYSYSFLGMYASSILKYEKTGEVDFDNNYLRAIRNKLIQNITNTPKSVLVPEILGTFGIRFPLNNTNAIKEIVSDRIAYDKEEIPIPFNGSGIAIPDNFGFPFVEKTIKGSDTKGSAYGSVDSPDYEWTGGSLIEYPYNSAISLVNLINTNVYERRSIKYLNQTYNGLVDSGVILNTEPSTANKNVPHMTNVFATSNVSNKINPPIVENAVINSIFSQALGDNAILQHYNIYSRFLNLFAKVYYLHGFKQKKTTAFAGQSFKFSSASLYNTNFVKAMDFRELNAGILEALPQGKRLLCKVMLFEGKDITGLFDKKVIDLFKNLYNQNQLFTIRKDAPAGIADDIIQIRPEATFTPVEINEAFGEFNNLLPSDLPTISNLALEKELKDFSSAIEQGIQQQEAYDKEKAAMMDKIIKTLTAKQMANIISTSGYIYYEQKPLPLFPATPVFGSLIDDE